MSGSSHVHAGQVFLVYEFIGNPGSLAVYLQTSVLDDASRIRLAQEAAQGMSYLHEHGVIHGDLKPGAECGYSFQFYYL